VDKQLVSRFMPSLSSFYLWVGLGTLFWGIIVLLVVPLDRGIGSLTVALTVLSGAIWGLGLLLFFSTLRYEEVSRATPLYGTFPIFVALLAVLFLSERLTWLQWLAVLITVAGAVLISLRRQVPKFGHLALTPSFWVLLSASLVTAAAHLITKHVLGELSLWNAYTLRQLGFAAPFLLVSLRPVAMLQVWDSLRNPTARWLMLGIEAIAGPAAVVLTLLAIQRGPVSLVSTLTATRPLFVFLFATLLSTPLWRMMDEPLERGTLAVKLVSIVLIILGVSGIALL
ncbi:MAG: DMT family transporter, partial [Dehalococcoidia bacterium]